MSKRVMAAMTLTAALVAGTGCKQDPDTVPPGPGPTAKPSVYNGRDVPPSGPINTESRMGSEGSMGR